METEPAAAPEPASDFRELLETIDAKRAELPDAGEKPVGNAFAATLERIAKMPVRAVEAAVPDSEVAERLRRSSLMGQLLKAAGGDRFRKCSFKDYKISLPLQQRVLDHCREFAATFKERSEAGEQLLLYGPVGTGKDHLAFAVCWEVVMAGLVESVGWVNGQSWYGKIRDAMDDDGTSERQIVEGVSRPQLLVVSDPQPPIGGLTPHQSAMLYRLVDARYCQRKTTIFTVNVKDDAEGDLLLGEAAWDRMNDKAWKLYCNWPSARKPAREVK